MPERISEEATIEFEILDKGQMPENRMGLLHKDSCCASKGHG